MIRTGFLLIVCWHSNHCATASYEIHGGDYEEIWWTISKRANEYEIYSWKYFSQIKCKCIMPEICDFFSINFVIQHAFNQMALDYMKRRGFWLFYFHLITQNVNVLVTNVKIAALVCALLLAHQMEPLEYQNLNWNEIWRVLYWIEIQCVHNWIEIQCVYRSCFCLFTRSVGVV